MSLTNLPEVLQGQPVLRPSGDNEREPTSDAGAAPDGSLVPNLDPVATFVVGGIPLRVQILRALQGSRFVMVGSASDVAALRIRRKGQRPSLALVEAGDGSGDIAGLISAIRQRSPGTRIVLLGDFGHPNWLQHPLAWVDGLVQDDARPEVLGSSLDLVMLDAAVLPTALTGLLIEQVRSGALGPLCHFGFGDWRPTDLRIRQLSVLEKFVLCCLKEGATNKAIARQLDLPVSAVSFAIKGILRKLGAKNRTQAALWALEKLPDNERWLREAVKSAVKTDPEITDGPDITDEMVQEAMQTIVGQHRSVPRSEGLSKALCASYHKTNEGILRALHEPGHVKVVASPENLAKIRHPGAKAKGSKSGQVKAL